MGKLKKILGAVLHGPERFDELAGRIAAVNRQVDYLASVVKDVDPEWLKIVADRLSRDGESLEMLNREMSVHRTVWGNPERLQIAPGAAVETCLFNVNSGRIIIGEYTFAGSNVSLLAGGHDPELRGFLRRDVEISEGCDIEIGRGVWLASGCTILGPCKIGDNAVIAAGAVVTPGTEIPADTIWGGVPAKQIGGLESGENGEAAAIRRALVRENGILFTKGWSEKKPIPGRAEQRRWMEEDEAEILTDRKQIRIEYGVEEANGCTLLVTAGDEEKEIRLAGTGEAELPGSEGRTKMITLKKTAVGKLWVRPMTEEETKA